MIDPGLGDNNGSKKTGAGLVIKKAEKNFLLESWAKERPEILGQRPELVGNNKAAEKNFFA
jgi:hypothetical protein